MSEQDSAGGLPPKEQRKRAKAELKAADQAHKHAVQDAARARDTARKAYEEQVKQAERAVRDAEKAHKEAVYAASNTVEKAEQGTAMAACAPFTLFPDRVYTPEGAVWLAPGMTASAETSGNVSVDTRPTLTRCCACGCIPAFFWRKKDVSDLRRLFISLSGPGVASVAAVPPNMEATARQFVAAFNSAAPSGPAARAERERAVSEARRALEQTEQDRSTIESAEAELERVRGNTAEVDKAEELVKLTEADTAAVDEARKRLADIENPG